MFKLLNQNKEQLLVVLIVSLQAQISLALGIFFSLLISLFYFFIQDSRFSQERPEILLAGMVLSLSFFWLGSFLAKVKFKNKVQKISIKQGMEIVLLTWVLAVLTSSLIYFLAGFPDPDKVTQFSLFRRMVDSIFESASGLTTAGGSILPDVEIFPRGILMWRSTTHILGVMGVSYASVILLKKLIIKRETVVNAELESTSFMEFKNEKELLDFGKKFAKVYFVLTFTLVSLLFVSGLFFRSSPYLTWYDNLFDALNYGFSAMATGGFGVYNSSVGLPVIENGQVIIGGLRNPVSEWIIAFAMFFSGISFSLWYLLLFDFQPFWHNFTTVKNKAHSLIGLKLTHLKEFFKVLELKVYVGLVGFLTFSIWLILLREGWASEARYGSILAVLRYAFFNVSSIISSAGLANTNFHLWPAAAIALIFVPYLTSGMAGSTSGGLKLHRFLVFFKYAWIKIQNIVRGEYKDRFNLDGIKYDSEKSSFIIVNILVYFLIFLLGAVAIMVLSPQVVFLDGSSKDIDLISGLTASLSNLGNIGPTTTLGSVDSGPSGNYAAYSESAKLVMVFLMFLGRVGVLSFLMLFITTKDSKEIVKVEY